MPRGVLSKVYATRGGAERAAARKGDGWIAVRFDEAWRVVKIEPEREPKRPRLHKGGAELPELSDLNELDESLVDGEPDIC